MADLTQSVHDLIRESTSALKGEAFYVTADDVCHIAVVHIERCSSRRGAGQKCNSLEEAIRSGWGNGTRCVRLCIVCRAGASAQASRLCCCL